MSPRPTPPRHANRAPFTLLVLGILGGGLVLLLGLNTVSAANELRRHDLAARDEAIAASLVEVRNAVAASAAPQNLALHAAAYGMVPAGNPAFLVVGRSGSVRVLGSPAPATAVPLPPPPASSAGNAAKAAKTAKTAKAAKSKHPKTTSPAQKRAHPSASTRTSAARNAATKRASAKTTSAKATTTSTAARTSAAVKPHAATPTKPAPSPTPVRPSSTPVPTISLPGGTR